MKVYLINKNGKIDITSIVTLVNIDGNFRSPCRNCNFSIIKSPFDPNTFVCDI